MQHSRLPDENSQTADLRLARKFVMRGERIPFLLAARLEATCIDVAALEQRLIEMNRFSL